MKNMLVKRIVALMLAVMMLAFASPAMAAEEAPEHIGSIMLLSSQTSGVQYDTAVAYLTAVGERLGYDLIVVYGDSFNDAAGNLQAVKNGMTSDVVGLIMMQDGGVLSIMEEYPELYVAGLDTDMISVFEGENKACLENDHFLGTIADGYVNGADAGRSYFNRLLDMGYKKIAVVQFPDFAYPAIKAQTETFLQLINEYNETAAEEDKVQVMGETTTLMFSPLEDSWFLEDGHDDLDAIFAFCSGVLFVFPVMFNAIANGLCSPDTKLVSGGFEIDSSIVDNIGDSEGKIISSTTITPVEDAAYPLILLDNAITGNQYEDFEVIRADAFEYVIDSDEDIQNVMTKSMMAENDVEKAQISVDTIVNELCKRNNPDATFAQLQQIFHDPEVVSVDALANK